MASFLNWMFFSLKVHVDILDSQWEFTRLFFVFIAVYFLHWWLQSWSELFIISFRDKTHKIGEFHFALKCELHSTVNSSFFEISNIFRSFLGLIKSVEYLFEFSGMIKQFYFETYWMCHCTVRRRSIYLIITCIRHNSIKKCLLVVTHHVEMSMLLCIEYIWHFFVVA